MLKNIVSFLLLSSLSLLSLAQINQPKEIQTSQKFGAYTVHYNIFNSKMLTPQITDTYKLTRGKDIALINIAVTKTENGVTSLGIMAKVSGKAINLMQQAKTIDFKEVKETDSTGATAIYYLAQFHHTNEEDMHFEIILIPYGETKPLNINFTRKLFTEN